MRTSTPSGKVARTQATGGRVCGVFPTEKDIRERMMTDPIFGGAAYVPPNKRDSRARVLRYRNPEVVLRIQRELHERGREINLAEARLIFQQTLEFLWGCQNGGVTSPTPDADHGWHVFILFTMDYQKFCHKYFGHFIHHKPFTAKERAAQGKMCKNQCNNGNCGSKCRSGGCSGGCTSPAPAGRPKPECYSCRSK